MGSTLRQILLLATLLASGAYAQADLDAEAKRVYEQIRSRASIDRLKSLVQSLTNGTNAELGSRPNRIEALLSGAGLKGETGSSITSEPVDTVRPEGSAVLIRGSMAIELGNCWPNLVTLNPKRLAGELVFAEDGDYRNFPKSGLRDKIVVLRASHGANWRKAASLGAKGIIFFGTFERAQGERMIAGNPVYMPRYWVADGEKLRTLHGKQVQIESGQQWTSYRDRNLYAVLPSSDNISSSETITFAGYSDGLSLVPSHNPAAQAAANSAAWFHAMEIVRGLPRKRNLRMALFAAHGLGLGGARQHVAKSLREGTGDLLTLTADLNTESYSLGAGTRAFFYDARDEVNFPIRSLSQVFREHSNVMAPVMGLPHPRINLADIVNNSDGRLWKNQMPGRYALDAEALSVAGMNALTITTTEAARRWVDTPFDTVDKIDFRVLQSQTARLAAYLFRALNDSSRAGALGNYRLPVKRSSPFKLGLTGGFGVVEGKTVFYDPQKSFIPNAPVPNCVTLIRGREPFFMGVRGDLVTVSDEDGKFRISGVPPSSAYWHRVRRKIHLLSYRLDPATGQVTAAVNFGMAGTGGFVNRFDMNSDYRNSPVVLFPCTQVDLYDSLDPQQFDPLTNLSILDADSNAEPRNYSYAWRFSELTIGNEIEDTFSVFLPPGQRFRILGQRGFETRMLLIGPYVPDGGGGVATLDHTSDLLTRLSASDTVALNQARIDTFSGQRILAPAANKLNTEARAKLAASSQAAPEVLAREGQRSSALAIRAYPMLLGTANDLVQGVVFYLALLIPFSIFFERIVFGSRNANRQAIVTLLIFVLSFLALRTLHPAFEIVPNPWVIFIAFVMGFLSIAVSVVIIGKFESGLRQSQAAAVSSVDTRRSKVMGAAVGLALGNLRRRPLRTFLTALTLVTMTFIVLSFTGIGTDVTLGELPREGEAAYSGLLVRNAGLEGMSQSAARALSLEFGAQNVARRVAYAGFEFPPTPVLTLYANSKLREMRCAAGFDAYEPINVSGALTSGRWFNSGERLAVILPETVFKELGRPESVQFAGFQLPVIGRFDEAKMKALRGLDGDEILPPDLVLSRQQHEQNLSQTKAFRSFQRLDPASCLIIPSELCLELQGQLQSIAVRIPREESREALADLMPRLRMNLYAGVPEGGKLAIKQFSVRTSSTGSGFGLVLVLTIVAAVFVMNTMSASVYERQKEIGILSALGLAPNHVAAMFFAEAAILGVLGAVGGYFVAQLVSKLIISTGSFGALTLNFSSTSAVLSAIVVMLTALLSAVYPARLAKRMAAPSMNIDYGKPDLVAGTWSVLLPFRISASEVPRLMAFFGEWLRGHENYTIGEFVASKTVVSEESVVSEVWPAPFDLGVQQRATLQVSETGMDGVVDIKLELVRLAGEPHNWERVNQGFLAVVRRQFLLWR